MVKIVYLFLFLSVAAISESLTNAKYLKAPFYFVNVDSSLRFLDVSKDEKFQSGPILFSDCTPAIPGAPIAVLPNNKYLFVGTYNKLIKFDNQFKIVEEFTLSRFSLKDDIHSFIGQAEASENSLWITVCEKYPKEKGWLQRYFVMKWDYNSSHGKVSCSPSFAPYCHWALNQEKDTIYIPGKDSVLYNYSTDVTKIYDWGWYNYADCSQSGLLLSEYPSKNNKNIKHVNLENLQETLLDKGSLANWGYDSLVYYCKGSTQLCSTDISGKHKETLFSATRDINFGNLRTDITVNNERNILSFVYTIPGFWSNVSSFILVDLKERNYRSFPSGILGTISVDWLKQDELKTSSESVPMNIFDAIRDGNNEAVYKAVLSESNIDRENKYGYAALYFAVTMENEDIVKYLINKGANVNAVSSSSGETPLHSAIRRDIKFMELLLKKGANPNITDNDGKTPLYDAVAINSLQKVQLLMTFGAKKEIKEKNGLTPLELAKTHGLEEIAAYLEQ